MWFDTMSFKGGHMDFLVIATLCSLATAKVSLQSHFSKKNLITSSDALFFNALIFLTSSILFLSNIPGTSVQIWLYSFSFALFTVTFQLSYTKALSIGNVSLTVMLVNLSMLFPVTVSAVIYQEPLSFTRLLGILLTVISFVFCIELKSKKSISWRWFLFSSLAMLSNGGIAITQKAFGSSSFHAEK
jgi:uncharacterized membrane protein